MYTVKKSFKIPIGHRLSKHNGRCSSIHGHNIKIDVEIQREKLNKNDMVIDFYDLKRIANETIDNWDHSMILNQFDDVSVGHSSQRMIIVTCGDPTSENMCFILYNIMNDKFTAHDKELKLKSISIWESDESYAKYEPE